jgi:hypothetical protein
MVILTVQQFQAHPTARRFADVLNDNRLNFQSWLDFFNNPAIQLRLQDAEIHHDRPALAGVVKQLEHTPAFSDYLSKYDSHTTWRGRQAIGVIVCLIMENIGWRRTGIKGSLGQRKAIPSGTATPGAYQNRSGISTWFTKAERYEPPTGYPY